MNIYHFFLGDEVQKQVNYDKSHRAVLVSDKPDMLQNVYILHTESPQHIIVCPETKFELIETLLEQCESYATKAKEGHNPSKGKMCFAQSKQDESWYHAACLDIKVNHFSFYQILFLKEVKI